MADTATTSTTEIPPAERAALIAELLASIKQPHYGPDEGHVEIHGNQVLGVHLIPGLEVESRSLPEGVDVDIRVKRGVTIAKPVHFCFGVLPDTGVQRIVSRTVIEDGASATFMAHCTFPNAVDVQHLMEATVSIGKNASLSYLERHVHGPKGGLTIVPTTKVRVDENGRYSTEFELIEGAAGVIELDYAAEVGAGAVVDMKTRVYGRLDDRIHIREAAHLVGEGAVGVLTSHIAIKDQSSANIENEIIADAPFSRGHVDCKEILQGQARARAVPIVQVNDHRAHVTHEAAIGSVDSKQLETLMSRGLDEDAATDLIIKGLLS
ncbi:MAG: SufD family Fe-S cluster assembly protein [Spirochaetales bacterium]|nr:SufD family Fe-S cluster assembly protein [Spirochaetales bacterium]